MPAVIIAYLVFWVLAFAVMAWVVVTDDTPSPDMDSPDSIFRASLESMAPTGKPGDGGCKTFMALTALCLIVVIVLAVIEAIHAR